jgi:hypothetical protein
LNTFIPPSILCARTGRSGDCTSTGGLLACAELALGLFVFSADSPALANSAAERLLAEANIPAPANALRMNPRLLLMCAPSKTRNARRDLRQRLYRCDV